MRKNVEKDPGSRVKILMSTHDPRLSAVKRLKNMFQNLVQASFRERQLWKDENGECSITNKCSNGKRS
jgi:hypothetical protein